MYTDNFCFGYIAVSCFFETFPAGWLAGLGGWLENLILMKTQSSAQTWTWTLDFDLGFVNFQSKILIDLVLVSKMLIYATPCTLSTSGNVPPHLITAQSWAHPYHTV